MKAGLAAARRIGPPDDPDGGDGVTAEAGDVVHGYLLRDVRLSGSLQLVSERLSTCLDHFSCS